MFYNIKRNKLTKSPNPDRNKKSVIRKLLKYFLIGFGSLIVLILIFIGWIYLSYFWGPEASEINDSHPFRAERTREKYLEFYDARAKEWPFDTEERMVSTSYGQTFVRINGPIDAPPMVLLPGGGTPSLMWVKNIEALSEDYRTYALDYIYDWGRSIFTRSVNTPEDLAKWLDELFTALELKENINLVGYSYGGWVASQYLLTYPNRLNKVVLTSPAYTVFPSITELEKKALIGFIPHKSFMRRSLYWACEDMVQTGKGREIDENMLDAHRLAIRCFKTKMPAIMTVLSDDELQRIIVPVLYLAGENEIMYSVNDAVKRLNRLAPDIKTEIVPNTGHCLIFTDPEIVSEKILDFLNH